MNEIKEFQEKEITCPYCGFKDTDSWESGLNNDGDTMTYDCPECDKKFYVSMCIDVTYSTNGLCKENNVKHNWKEFDHTTDGVRCKGKRCLTCNEYEWDKYTKQKQEKD